MDEANAEPELRLVDGLGIPLKPLGGPKPHETAQNAKMPMPKPTGRRILVEILPRSQMIQPLRPPGGDGQQTTFYNEETYAMIVRDIGPGEAIWGIHVPVDDEIEVGSEVFLVAGVVPGCRMIEDRAYAILGTDMICGVWTPERSEEDGE